MENTDKSDKQQKPGKDRYLQKLTRVFQETGRRIGRLLGKMPVEEIKKPYPKQLVVSSNTFEVRVALLENNVAVEFLQEWKQEQGTVGNIYRGRVTNVLPGMQAAFVDIGQEKAGFLYISEVSETLLDEYESWGGKAPRKPRKRSQKIQDIVHEGQELIVQIAKDAMGTKGARLTSHISLPGRFIVFMPTETHVGISRRISQGKERHRLKEIIQKIKPIENGVIVRTEAEGCSEEELAADLGYLVRTWKKIKKKSEESPPATLIHSELDPVLKSVRELFTSDTDRLLIDNKEDYRRVAEFVRTFSPHFRQRVAYHSGRRLLFDILEIEPEIQKLLRRKVWLKSGGHLLIDETEALVSIDVNTGRFVGKGNLEETVLKTNLEAVKEISRQLRLRNLGGIIILDLIDMSVAKNREKVYRALDEALKPDKANTKILKISQFGLVEMTRKRTRESVLKLLTRPCPYCEGRSYIKDNQTICSEIFREIQRIAPRTRERHLEVKAHADIVTLLLDEKRDLLVKVEKQVRKKVHAKVETAFHHEQFEVKGRK
jgi:ribonuclease G